MPKIVNITNTTYGRHPQFSAGLCFCHGPVSVATHTPTMVLSDGQEVSILTDIYTEGVCFLCVTIPIPIYHLVKVIVASPNVFAGGIPIVRNEDLMTCPDRPGLLSSISNVSVN